MSAASTSYFDSKAAEWDEKPHHIESAKRAVAALLSRVPTSRETTSVLDFGCGTGLCSAMLEPHVARVVGVDTSLEMVHRFNSKAERLNAQHKMKAVQALLESPREQLGDAMPEAGFDLVFSHLTLHHVEDINGIIKTLVRCLSKEGGVLAISDFKRTDHSHEFHPTEAHKEVKHHGICPAKLKLAMEAAGLGRVQVDFPFDFEKPTERGGTRTFPFLFAIGHAGASDTSS